MNHSPQSYRTKSQAIAAHWLLGTKSFRAVVTLYRSYGLSNDQCAERILQLLNESGITHTPDGVKYTITGIRAAIGKVSS